MNIYKDDKVIIGNVVFKYQYHPDLEPWDFDSDTEFGKQVIFIPKEILLSYCSWCDLNKESLPDFRLKKMITTSDNIFFYMPYLDEEFLTEGNDYIIEQEDGYLLRNIQDAFIAFGRWLIDQNLKCEIIVGFHHISWLFHDIFHMQNHVSSNQFLQLNINVNASREIEAMYHSFEKCKELEYSIPHIYRELIHLYNRRFASTQGFILEEFFEEEDED